MTQAIALGIFLLGAITTYVIADVITKSTRQQNQQYMNQQAATMSNHLTTEFAQYDQILKHAAAFYELDDTGVTLDEWRRYINKSESIVDHPSLLGIGFVKYLKPDQVAEHGQYLSDTYGGNINVTPQWERDEYTAITFLEPQVEVNRQAIGYDMFSGPVRRKAMEAARDKHAVSMSAPVHLVQDIDNPDKYGVLFYYPIFDEELSAETDFDKKDALYGYVYIVVRPSDVAETIDKTTVDADVEFIVSDEGTTVYRNNDRQAQDNASSATIHLDMYDRTWNVEAIYLGKPEAYIQSAAIIMITGALASGLLSILVYGILARRIKFMKAQYKEVIDTTKSELVMLASHQLRTPASGVKQYLGMLREGMFGKLDKTQAAILNKAYLANEHQIETINQILHIAKADAGQLALAHEPFDMARLIREEVDILKSQAKDKNIKIAVKASRSAKIVADRRYMAMAIENLISNAIKYSFDGSTVDVAVTSRKSSITVKVHDKGVGISKQDLPRIFEKFVRLQNPLSVKEGGTGLGLFLTKEIIEAHNGKISAKSTQKSGTEFTFRVPTNLDVRLQ